MSQAVSFMRKHTASLQIFLDILTLMVASVIFFCLGTITFKFEGNCLLYSDLSVKIRDNDTFLDLAKTSYDEGTVCSYTTYVNVVIAIHSIIWIWFFIHMDSLKSSNGSVLHLLLPVLICRVVFLICIIVSTVKIYKGFSVWCDNITSNIYKSYHINYSCDQVQDLKWTRSKSKFYLFSQMAASFSLLLIGILIVSCAMTLLHLYFDFQQTMESQLKPRDGYITLEGDNIPSRATGRSGSNVSDESRVEPQETDLIILADVHDADEQEKDYELPNEAPNLDSSSVRNRSIHIN